MVAGGLDRYHKKSVTVVSDDGGQWAVSREGVLPKAESSGAARKTGTVIDAHELGDPFRRGDDVSRY